MQYKILKTINKNELKNIKITIKKIKIYIKNLKKSNLNENKFINIYKKTNLYKNIYNLSFVYKNI